jgi:cytochrome c
MISTHSLVVPFALSLLSVAACGSGQAASPGATSPETTTHAAAAGDGTFEAQATRGAGLYAAHCGSCHGAGGEGKGAPRVVGLKDGALSLAPPANAKARKGNFTTVGDVATFVVKTMPPAAPGSLPPADYLAILAFDLRANGVVLERPLDLAGAADLKIPR